MRAVLFGRTDRQPHDRVAGGEVPQFGRGEVVPAVFAAFGAVAVRHGCASS
jgi:hypothetical protein